MSIRFTIEFSRNPQHQDDDYVANSTSIEIKLSTGSQIDDPLILERHVSTLVNACRRAISERAHDEHRPAVRIPHARQSDMQAPQSIRTDNRDMHASALHGGQRQTGHSHQDAHQLRASRSQRRAIRAICRCLNITPMIAAMNHHFSWASLSRQQARTLFDQLRRLEENQSERSQYLRAGVLPHGASKDSSGGARY